MRNLAKLQSAPAKLVDSIANGAESRFHIVLARACVAVLVVFSSTTVFAQEPKPTQEPDTAIQSEVRGKLDPVTAKAFEFVLLAQSDYKAGEGKLTDEAMLGVHVRQADDTLRSQLGITGKFGMVIEHVTEESAAAKADLRLHDVLHKLDGQLLVNLEQFQTLIDSRKPGDNVDVEFFRNGQTEKLRVELSQRKRIDMGETIHGLEKYHAELILKGHLESGTYDFDHKSVQFLNCKDCHQSANQSQDVLDVFKFQKHIDK